MIDTAKSLQELHLVMTVQLMLNGKTTKHIDGVEPSLLSAIILIQIAFLADARVGPESFKIQILYQLVPVATLVSALIPFCHIDNG